MPDTDLDAEAIDRTVIDAVDEVHRFAAEAANKCHVSTTALLEATLVSVGRDLNRRTDENRPEIRDGDIPLAEAQIAWDYNGPDPEAPPVVVIGRQHERWANRDYHATWGACMMEFDEATDDEKLLMLFKQAHWMGVTGDWTPAQAHEAFLVIPEYRAQFPKGCLPDPYREEL